MTTLFLATRNILRKAWRSIALALAVGLVACLLFAGSISVKGITDSINLGAMRLGADLMVVPAGQEKEFATSLLAGRPSPFYMPGQVLEQLRQVRGVRRVSPQLFMKLSSYACCSPVDAILIAFDPESDFTIGPWLQASLKRPLSEGEVILGHSIPIAVGTSLKFYEKNLVVAGDLAETGVEYIDHGVFMTFATAREMIAKAPKDSPEPLEVPADSISTVMVQLEEGITPERGKVFVEYEIDGVRALPSQEVVGSVKGHLTVLVRVIFGVGVALWLVTLVLVGIVFTMIVNERQREIGMIRALGARRGLIFRLITLEAALVSLAGGSIGVGAGYAFLLFFVKPLAASLNLPYLWPDSFFIGGAAAAVIFLGLLSGMVAALYPAWRSSRMPPYEAIRAGE